ncbi:MAG: HAD family hydrolase [Blautia sp.]
MIKLIASDLDGTLLQGTGEISEKAVNQIKKLSQMGILFVAASGRQYPNLRRLFAPVQDEIAYICENGALVVYKDEILHKDVFDRGLEEEILNSILETEGAEALVSGERTSYIKPKDPGFYDYMVHFVKNDTTVFEEKEEIKEPFLKVSVYDKAGVEAVYPFWNARFGDRATVVTSGFEWLDMMPKGADKGNAIKVLQERLGIYRDESVAFGDNYNDLEMLAQVKYSFATGDAKEAVKEICFSETKRVETVLERIINEGGEVE